MSSSIHLKKDDEWEKLPGAVMCSCKTGKILYKCIDTKCPNHLTKPTYCYGCLNTKEHYHFPLKKAISVIKETTEVWTAFKQRYDTLATSAATSYKKVEPLIKYLE